MLKVNANSTTEYKNSNSYSLSNFSDREIEKIIKVKMLDVFDYNLKYYYNTSIKFTNSYDIFKKNIDLFLKQDFNLIDIIKEFKLPYPKLDKNSFKRFINIYNKSVKDFNVFVSSQDLNQIYKNKGNRQIMFHVKQINYKGEILNEKMQKRKRKYQ